MGMGVLTAESCAQAVRATLDVSAQTPRRSACTDARVLPSVTAVQRKQELLIHAILPRLMTHHKQCPGTQGPQQGGTTCMRVAAAWNASLVALICASPSQRHTSTLASATSSHSSGVCRPAEEASCTSSCARWGSREGPCSARLRMALQQPAL